MPLGSVVLASEQFILAKIRVVLVFTNLEELEAQVNSSQEV